MLKTQENLSKSIKYFAVIAHAQGKYRQNHSWCSKIIHISTILKFVEMHNDTVLKTE